MDKSSLFEWLESENVSRSAYRLDGSMAENALTLEHLDDGTWRVFYSERGTRGKEWDFGTESDACLFLARELLTQNFDRFIRIADGEPSSADAEFDEWLTANRITSADLGEKELLVEEYPNRKRYFVHGYAVLRLTRP